MHVFGWINSSVEQYICEIHPQCDYATTCLFYLSLPGFRRFQLGIVSDGAPESNPCRNSLDFLRRCPHGNGGKLTVQLGKWNKKGHNFTYSPNNAPWGTVKCKCRVNEPSFSPAEGLSLVLVSWKAQIQPRCTEAEAEASYKIKVENTLQTLLKRTLAVSVNQYISLPLFPSPLSLSHLHLFKIWPFIWVSW